MLQQWGSLHLKLASPDPLPNKDLAVLPLVPPGGGERRITELPSQYTGVRTNVFKGIPTDVFAVIPYVSDIVVR